MSNWLVETFNVEKPIIGMLHFPPTPGQPLYDEKKGLNGLRDALLRDAEALTKAGVDGFLFANEGDRPYRSRVLPSTIATMAALIPQVVKEFPKPFGVAVLADPVAAVYVGAAVGASFVRAFLTWNYVSDWGLIEPQAAEVLALRRNLHAQSIKLLANLTGHSLPLEGRGIRELARGAEMVGLADALCVSGETAGSPITPDMIRATREGSSLPVVIGSGASEENIETLLRLADATLVGTSIKVNRNTFNPVDPARAKAFVEAARRARE